MIVKSMTLINKSKALIDKSKAMIWIYSDIVVTFDFVEGIFVRQYRDKKVFLFCIVLTFSYLCSLKPLILCMQSILKGKFRT